ncbi:DUF2535 family protein [Bacillus sp. ISL-51]|uniref:DUF2535 family protein n=1 Tax=Bacteria TaxID=2 RepID=UPI001BEAB5E0|nr:MULTISPECIES: DUF2535 family protein [Bacillus]MBT2575371.1 DUF2535 family protein [Bacillus sp. ISL-51]MBT2713008.1 DUF2535 family protein [Pseudomonas sp. ISL-88]MBY8914068.1 YpmP family protein [Bacillus sp. YC2]MCP6682111.1 YpmP family protein [Bacillus nakamurai]
MLLKSLEFKRRDGIQVKVTDIPVVTEGEHYFFQIHQHLELYLREVFASQSVRTVYSFRQYVKRRMKWKDYEAVFNQEMLKHNA